MNWRRSEWITVGGIALAGGLWWQASDKVHKIDEHTVILDQMQPRVEKLEIGEAEIRSVQTTQMTLIIRELDAIHREMKRSKEAFQIGPLEKDNG